MASASRRVMLTLTNSASAQHGVKHVPQSLARNPECRVHVIAKPARRDAKPRERPFTLELPPIHGRECTGDGKSLGNWPVDQDVRGRTSYEGGGRNFGFSPGASGGGGIGTPGDPALDGPTPVPVKPEWREPPTPKAQ